MVHSMTWALPIDVPLHNSTTLFFHSKKYVGRRVHTNHVRYSPSEKGPPFTSLAVAAVGGDAKKRWGFRNVSEKLKGEGEVGEKVMRLLAGATSAPFAHYIASPLTPLHSLDPRVKQAWLLALVVLPSRSHVAIRIGSVLLLVFASIWALPRRTWQDQLGRMSFLSIFLLVMVCIGTDGAPPLVQTRTPPAAMDHLPVLPEAFGGYKYVLWKFGPMQLTRKGLSLGVTASCLSFTVLQSASLCLSTTTPEDVAAALRWYLTPFSCLGAPIDEMVLTLLLSLRFVSLVFDEVRSIALSTVARGVQWKSMTWLQTIDVYFACLGRLFKNLFNHAEQISLAMIARGFKGNPAQHKIYFLNSFSLKTGDLLAIFCLVAVAILALVLDSFLC